MEKVDEMIMTFNDLLAGAEEGKGVIFCHYSSMSSHSRIGWQAVPALGTMNKLTARVTNRIYVGLPFCAYKDSVHCVETDVCAYRS